MGPIIAYPIYESPFTGCTPGRNIHTELSSPSALRRESMEFRETKVSEFTQQNKGRGTSIRALWRATQGTLKSLEAYKLQIYEVKFHKAGERTTKPAAKQFLQHTEFKAGHVPTHQSGETP